MENGSLESALLIDRFPIHFCTIDKIEILGDYGKTPGNLENLLNGSIEFQEPQITKYPYRYLIQSVAGFTVLIRDPSNKDIPYLKLIFNPNKLADSPAFVDLINSMKNKRYSRIDYAVDYEHSLADYLYCTNNPKKSSSIFGKSGALETHYIGMGYSGSTRYRVYNKALEQKFDNGDVLWRIEAEIRLGPKDDYLDHPPFRDLDVLNPAFQDEPNIRDRAMLYYLAEYPSQWEKLDARTRRKYKSLLKDSHDAHRLWPTPYSCYLYRKETLDQELMFHLSNPVEGYR